MYRNRYFGRERATCNSRPRRGKNARRAARMTRARARGHGCLSALAVGSDAPQTGRILSTAEKRFPDSPICEGATDGFETT